MESEITYAILAALIILTFVLSRTKFIRNLWRKRYIYFVYFAFALYFALQIFIDRSKWIYSSILTLIAIWFAIKNVLFTHRKSGNQ